MLDSHFIMKIVYLLISLCIFGDVERIYHRPRIFKYREDNRISVSILKDIMLWWIMFSEHNKNDVNDYTMLNHPHLC